MNHASKILAALIASSFACAASPQQADTEADAGTSTTAGSLVYTPLTPCRLLDTRQPSLRGGRFERGEERSFFSTHPALDEQQGGAETDCGVPLRALAITINLTGVEPDGRGFLTAWAHGQERPLAATLSLLPGENISNAITIPVDNDFSTDDFTIYAWERVDVVADVVGYYAPLERSEPECYPAYLTAPMVIGPGQRSVGLAPACEVGFTRVEGWCDLAGQEDLVIIESRPSGDYYRCDIRNIGTQTREARPYNRCCDFTGH